MLRRIICAVCALLLCAPALAEKTRSAGIEGVTIVDQDDGHSGYRLDSGEWLVEPIYTGASAFVNGYAVVTMQIDETAYSHFGLIDTSGALVLPLEYDWIDDVREDGTVEVNLNDEDFFYALMPEGPRRVAAVESDLGAFDLVPYAPFVGEWVTKLGEEPEWNLRSCPEDELPRLDGATALFPAYSAVVEAVYPDTVRLETFFRLSNDGSESVIKCSTTEGAYDALIEGDADVIFCAGPSDAQLQAAKEAGVEFELTPIGRDAFVFIVNRENPLDGISVAQIRQVYGGEITRWDQLGVQGLGEIMAYQRPEGSGSQTTMERIMGDSPLMEAPSERIEDSMSAIVETVALNYRNLPNAIGYSFRVFCVEMMDADVKLLSIDGVEPTPENIRNGSYPFATTGYAITRRGETNPRVGELLTWLTSEQGQSLIEKCGYVAYAEQRGR